MPENNTQPQNKNIENKIPSGYQEELNALVDSFNEGFITDHSLKKELEELRGRYECRREDSFQRRMV